MKVLIVSGIWPPDVGGPASHAPEVAAFLQEHGHEPHVIVTADAQPAPRPYPVDWVPRGAPPGVRHLRSLAAVRRLARTADVVYSTGMFGRSGAGSLLARRPYVLKLTADPAFERARRRGLHDGSLAEFQAARSARTWPLRAARDAIVQRAAHLVCPSAFLAELTAGWGVPPERVTVLPNPAPDVSGLPERDELRARHGFDDADARLRRPADRAEVARARDRRGASGGRAARDRRRRPRPRTARGARRGDVPGRAAARDRARALPRRGRLDPVLELGELPARHRRVARRRHAGDRDRRRRRRGGGDRRRERPARSRARRHRADRGRAQVPRRARPGGAASRQRRSLGGAVQSHSRVRPSARDPVRRRS